MIKEVDQLVAEKVMGFTVYSVRKGLYENGNKVISFEPLTNIADAWVILDQFDDYELCGTPFKNDYCAKLKKDGKWFSSESSVSQEHAICLAALKAVGVKIDSIK
jgi:hypothetical protein